MEAWKGHSLQLNALARLRPDLNWMCWFVGGAQRASEHAYVNQLHRQVEGLGLGKRIQFLGQRADVPELLGAADVHCQPNLQPEPFGLTFVEAMQAGLPVVTTAIGGATEIIDESCGILIGENNPVALADALSRLIERPELRRQMGEAGRRRGRQLFGPHAQMPKISNFLKSVVNA
jgi:glycosyltransferase involved in cell wall biosynthesis